MSLIRFFTKKVFSSRLIGAIQANLRSGKGKQNPENLLYMNDDIIFNNIYNKSLLTTGTEHRPARKHRFFNIYSLLRNNANTEGDYVEFGCWKGASSHLIMQTMVDLTSQTENRKLYIFDSFEGLSVPQKQDNIKSQKVARIFGKKIDSPFKTENSYRSSLETLHKNLEEYKGLYSASKVWVDSTIISRDIGMPDKIAFANIDLDLYEPTYFAIKAVLERLSHYGFIVCDDYGSVSWPGAREAVNQIADEHNLKLIELSSGQALIFRNL